LAESHPSSNFHGRLANAESVRCCAVWSVSNWLLGLHSGKGQGPNAGGYSSASQSASYLWHDLLESLLPDVHPSARGGRFFGWPGQLLVHQFGEFRERHALDAERGVVGLFALLRSKLVVHDSVDDWLDVDTDLWIYELRYSRPNGSC